MIKVTKLNGKEYFINSELIETVASTPDTVITTVHGKVFVVQEDIELLIDRIIEFKGRAIEFKYRNGGESSGG